MARKPTRDELEQRIRDLEEESAKGKRAEEALRKSEERFRRLFEDDLTGDFITTADGLILECNPAFLRIFGYKNKAEALRERITALYPEPSERASILDRLRATGKLQNYETIRKRKDDSVITVNENIVATFDEDGKLIEVKGYIYDITERNRAEEALRESEERYRSLFKNNHAVMLLIDPLNAAITDANPAACAYYGWSIEELMKLRIDEINILTPDEVHAQMQLARSEKRNHFFFKHRRADGTIRDVEVYSGPILLKGKALLYSIVHDITERKQAEEALDDERKRLQKALDDVRTLRGIVPICASCKKIRDDKGYWNQVEKYVSEHSEAEFSHGICPECMKKLYPEFAHDESNQE